MNITEKTELLLIGLVGGVIWFIQPMLPTSMLVARLILYGAALLLLQGLVRDLWLLFQSRGNEAKETKKAMQLMCLESTIGGLGILIGAGLSIIGFAREVEMFAWTWLILVVVVLVLGFLIKDLVIEWAPWRIRRDKNHMNIIFSWKKP